MGSWDMELILPKEEGPMLQHKITKLYSRLDLVLYTSHSTSLIMECRIKAKEQLVNTDYFSITFTTQLSDELSSPQDELSYNFHTTNWEQFRKALKPRLQSIGTSISSHNHTEVDKAVANLTEAIQQTIHSTAKKNSY